VRRVVVVTGTRAEYGLLKPVMDEIQNAGLELRVVLTGMHLQAEFGQTEKEIESDGVRIDARVPMAAADDGPASMVQSIATGVSGLGRAFEAIAPDVVVVLGDRVEAFAAAVAAAGTNNVIAHLHGGEVTRGGLDESMRHAITKLAHLHFAATEKSRERIIRMGERSDRVFVVGAPGVDVIRRTPRLSLQDLEKTIGAPLPKPLVVLVQHPVTTRADEAAGEMREALEAVAAAGQTTVCIYPNSDAGGRRMIEVIESFRGRPWLRIRPSLDHPAYLSLLAHADVLVGNTSSGIIEAPLLRLPFVNVGDRQAGRERGENVIDVPARRNEIGVALERALNDGAFRERIGRTESPYGDGRASERIVAVLCQTTIGPELLQKQFVD
jgi:UDP-N-acetylglucosamine 2-epimerase (non-hydrolysing)/GDP/UDP-N,N'-diacetylbacillosamine 2-epimerase (hydrolysing)